MNRDDLQRELDELSMALKTFADAVEEFRAELEDLTEITITEQATHEVSRVLNAIENCFEILHSKNGCGPVRSRSRKPEGPQLVLLRDEREQTYEVTRSPTLVTLDRHLSESHSQEERKR